MVPSGSDGYSPTVALHFLPVGLWTQLGTVWRYFSCSENRNLRHHLKQNVETRQKSTFCRLGNEGWKCWIDTLEEHISQLEALKNKQQTIFSVELKEE